VKTRGLLASLAVMSLLVTPVVPGQDAKDKDKEAAKEKAKAKPPARSYSDDDLKKYKDPPKDKPKDDKAGAQAGSAGESGAAAEPAPRQRRSREYGGYQELPPEAPPTAPPTRAQIQNPEQPSAPAPAEETRSPEEVEWKRRAVEARRPVEAVQGQIAQIDSEMAGLKDQLNPMSASYVLGGNSTAGPGAVLEIEEKLRNLESRRVDAKGELAQAEKGWQSFLEEARAAGANPAWFTP
jgi:hypothetical protein